MVKELHTCSHCGQTFTYRSNLMRHARIHSGLKPYKCTRCKVSFTRKEHLIAHERTHTGKKPFKCEYCAATFTEKKTKVIHTRTHTGQKPHQCAYCDAAFVHRGSLKSHLMTHSDKKPYLCSICGAAFTRRGTLRKHSNLHTGERPHHCNVCNGTFTRREHLANHMKTHTGQRPYQCAHCMYKGVTKQGLINHLKIHSDSEEMAADYYLRSHKDAHFRKIKYKSDKAYVNLTEHKKLLHSRKSLFKCQICVASFALKQDLKSHMKMHGGEECVLHECETPEVTAKCGSAVKKQYRNDYITSVLGINVSSEERCEFELKSEEPTGGEECMIKEYELLQIAVECGSSIEEQGRNSFITSVIGNNVSSKESYKLEIKVEDHDIDRELEIKYE